MKILTEKIKKVISGFLATQVILTFLLIPQAVHAAAPSAPVASPVSGTYNAAQNVTLTPDAVNAQSTYYTTDGSAPSNLSTLYSGGTITIDGTNGVTVVLKAVSYDGPGGTGSIGTVMTENYLFDKLLPTINGVTDGTYYNTNVVPTFSDTSGATGMLNGSPFTSGTTISVEDNYGLTVTDGAGNISFVSFVIDKTVPLLTLNGSNPMYVERGTAFSDPLVSVTDVGGMGLVTPIGGGFDTSIIGTYYVTYNATDKAGNVATPVTRTVIVQDTQPPVVTLPVNPVITSSAYLYVAQANDGLFALKNVAWSDSYIGNPGTVTFSNINNLTTMIWPDIDGSYTIGLTATDAADLTDTKTMIFIRDTMPPVVSAGPNQRTNQEITVTGTATDITSGIKNVHWMGAGVTFGSPNSLSTTMSATSAGTHTVTLIATDNAGNTSSSEMTLVWDTAAPKLASVLTPPLAGDTLGLVDQDLNQQSSDSEVKAGSTDEKKEEKKDEDKKNQNNLPAFGIAVLVILALIGLYLLYLQNPAAFKWLLFWKKKE